MSLCSRLLVLYLMLAPSAGAATALHFVTEEFPPFSYSRGTQASGALSEIVNLTCFTLQWQCSIEVWPWRRALQMAENGEVDGIFTVIDSHQRRDAFNITPMLVQSGYDFYTTRASSFLYQSPSDLQGHIVGVYGPSGTSLVLQDKLRNVPNVDIQLITNNQRLLLMLHAGRFGTKGVVVLNQDVARHLIEHEQLYALRHAGHLSGIAYGIGFSRLRVPKEVFERFTQQLLILRQNGQIETIVKRYGLQMAH
ncbi:substrate-binding periplasmic protein [Pseudomonas sp. 5P_3.1_Bac2]|uniref:substrate-binding periplasmic protein n=1 Tax=Pseudomonas sp. 5P_3.1_Bac2 TaxID=2971617 RepID=UPI0021C94FF6|nr:transporter substrate-binding domain-containing protein [Pseudomonas sp. 5P_3.1_Bac2]MCU1715719.1 transporter substrate-binding domain-containing protein [Pseudomonas sp. 5P_3.1_Bac2]